ncbi:MAG: hypothetical protein U0165_00640 [Polyangiaceae bacterium]
MDRNSLLKTSLFVLAALVFFQFVLPKITGSDGPRVQPITSSLTGERKAPPEPEVCTLKGPRFTAKLSSDGAAVREFFVDGAKYTRDGKEGSPPMSSDDARARGVAPASLRVVFGEERDASSRAVLRLEARRSRPTRKLHVHAHRHVELRKTVRTVDRPFELEVEMSVKNVGTERASHRASVSTTAWRTEKIAGGFGRQSPYVRRSSAATTAR